MPNLSEGRVKQRYTLTPRGKALFEDENRFGTKMLEKMGWSKGKGLGANEDGSQDFVRLKYKNDDKGLGFVARDDQWTEHDDSFNNLLEKLNNENADNTSDVEMSTIGFGFPQKDTKKSKKKLLKENITNESLEEKSKHSRARVHYKKFTRGKDLTRYSEKDLANIFGRKPMEGNDNDTVQDVKENNLNSECKINELFQQSNLSVNDYFKEKMKAKKGSSESNQTETEKIENKIEETEIEEEVKTKKKKKKRNIAETTDNNLENENIEVKKKKNKHNCDNNNLENNDLELTEVSDNVLKEKKKKSKSKKNHILNETKEVVHEIDTNVNNVDHKEEVKETSIEVKKKKKNKKPKPDTEVKEATKTSEYIKDAEKSKKSKKKSKANNQIDDNNISIDKNHVKENFKEAEKTTVANNVNCENKSSKKKKNQEVKEKDIEQIKKDIESNNTLEISAFAAEKFRYVNLDGFPGANLGDIPGYGFDKNMKLKIVKNKSDEKRIVSLWSSTVNKYELNPQTADDYKKYCRETKEARKTKQKLPHFKIHNYKRKNIFKDAIV